MILQNRLTAFPTTGNIYIEHLRLYPIFSDGLSNVNNSCIIHNSCNRNFRLLEINRSRYGTIQYKVNWYKDIGKQGGSVMCVRTWGSDPAHPHFWVNWLPNDEELENLQQHTYRSINNEWNTIVYRCFTPIHLIPYHLAPIYSPLYHLNPLCFNPSIISPRF